MSMTKLRNLNNHGDLCTVVRIADSAYHQTDFQRIETSYTPIFQIRFMFWHMHTHYHVHVGSETVSILI